MGSFSVCESVLERARVREGEETDSEREGDKDRSKLCQKEKTDSGMLPPVHYAFGNVCM